MLWRIVCGYEADPELQRDLNQEVLLAIWRALPRFEGNASVRTYLARIAHNRCVTHVTREAARPRGDADVGELVSGDRGPTAVVEELSRARQLHAAVRRLPLPHRQVIMLALEDLAPREIAEVLGVNANTVSIRLTRAKKALKDLMEADS